MISRLQPKLETRELRKEPVLSLPGLEIYPNRRKVYHDQQEIELNIKKFSLLYLLSANKGRVPTYGQMYQGVWKEEPFGNENIAVVAMCAVCAKAVCGRSPAAFYDFLYPGHQVLYVGKLIYENGSPL